ncbi:hypothetical protein [Aliidiomarina indica]|uniref:hypothetical protein n=1 Tax=Aliidiomarina indica TaxID=2749147 RepID=UPI00188E6116|nr:hypothetical protein [Aliidiomarina indica]
MSSNPYKGAGIAALILAVLFPIYWLHPLHFLAVSSFQEILRADVMTLNAWDGLFVLIGALEVYIYLMLARMCRDQLNGELPAVLLYVMAGFVVLFHATVLFDVAVALGVITELTDTMVALIAGVSLTFVMLYALVAVVFAITLLMRFVALSAVMKVFTIGLLSASFLQLTIVLGVANIFLFPILLVLLAIQFLRNDHSVEVV